MRIGENIKGYVITTEPTNAGGGTCVWAFAEKNGVEYFIKEFLSPTYPVEGSPGSAEVKEKIRRECEIFEGHHRKVMMILKDKCSDGGNLIITKDFFLYKGAYYKITEKVDVTSLGLGDVARLPIEKRMLILKTIAFSLRILHKVNIVHSDLKPNNILIKQTVTGNTVAKLIDFDDSYISGEPPVEITGDTVYLSPEMRLYNKDTDKKDRSKLTLNSDIFTLGLIFCEYLTGRLPEFDREKYRYAHEAALDNVPLVISGSNIPVNLINWMLRKNHDGRPDIEVVFETVKSGRDISPPDKSVSMIVDHPPSYKRASEDVGTSTSTPPAKKPNIITTFESEILPSDKRATKDVGTTTSTPPAKPKIRTTFE